MPLTPAQQAFFDDLQASFTGFKEALKFALRWDNDRVGTSLVEGAQRPKASESKSPHSKISVSIPYFALLFSRTDAVPPWMWPWSAGVHAQYNKMLPFYESMDRPTAVVGWFANDSVHFMRTIART